MDGVMGERLISTHHPRETFPELNFARVRSVHAYFIAAALADYI